MPTNKYAENVTAIQQLQDAANAHATGADQYNLLVDPNAAITPAIVDPNAQTPDPNADLSTGDNNRPVGPPAGTPPPAAHPYLPWLLVGGLLLTSGVVVYAVTRPSHKAAPAKNPRARRRTRRRHR